MMGITQCMHAKVAKIGFPVIVNEDTFEIRQNPHTIHCLLSSFRINMEQNSVFIRKAM